MQRSEAIPRIPGTGTVQPPVTQDVAFMLGALSTASSSARTPRAVTALGFITVRGSEHVALGMGLGTIGVSKRNVLRDQTGPL